jgi:5-methylcytosine-specific restriction endonuclease McrA
VHPHAGKGPGDDCISGGRRLPLSLCVVPGTESEDPPGRPKTRCQADWEPGPYKDVADVRKPGNNGYRFDDDDQRYAIFQTNWINNGSRWTPDGKYWILKSDGDGRDMYWDPVNKKAARHPGEDPKRPPQWSKNAPEIDHICPTDFGGRNDNANACVLSKEENIHKSNKPPFRCGSR